MRTQYFFLKASLLHCCHSLIGQFVEKVSPSADSRKARRSWERKAHPGLFKRFRGFLIADWSVSFGKSRTLLRTVFILEKERKANSSGFFRFVHVSGGSGGVLISQFVGKKPYRHLIRGRPDRPREQNPSSLCLRLRLQGPSGCTRDLKQKNTIEARILASIEIRNHTTHPTEVQSQGWGVGPHQGGP